MGLWFVARGSVVGAGCRVDSACGGGCGAAKGVWAKRKEQRHCTIITHATERRDRARSGGETRHSSGARPVGGRCRLEVAAAACCAAGARANKITQAWINTGGGRGCSRRGGGGSACRGCHQCGGHGRERLPPRRLQVVFWLVHARIRQPMLRGQYSRGSGQRRRRACAQMFFGLLFSGGCCCGGCPRGGTAASACGCRSARG